MAIDNKNIKKIMESYDLKLAKYGRGYNLLLNGKCFSHGREIWLSFGCKLPNNLDKTDRAAVDASMSAIDGAIKIDLADLVDLLADDKEKALKFRNRGDEIRRRKKASKEVDKIVCKAFGAVEFAISTSMDNDAYDLAHRYGINTDMDGAVTDLGGGKYGYSKLVSRSIDDFEVMVIVVKGVKAGFELLDFIKTRTSLFKILWSNNWDLCKAKITCWETGIEYGFWDIRTEGHLSAWDSLKQRVEYFNDSFGGE